MKKKYSLCCLLIIVVLIGLLSGCNTNKKTPGNNTTASLDELYNHIKNSKFDNLELVDLNYEQMNKTTILVGERGFGARESIIDENSESTQRILVYKGKDGTQISIILGKIITDTPINNNIISIYSDDLKKNGLDNTTNTKSHMESSVYLYNNIIINVVGINLDKELDGIFLINFNEKLIEAIKSFSKE